MLQYLLFLYFDAVCKGLSIIIIVSKKLANKYRNFSSRVGAIVDQEKY